MIFGVAGNKCDLFQQEQVTEEEGKKFAKSIGAVFHLTSCKESIGIDELFEECGKKYLEMNKLIDSKEKGKIHLDKDKANIEESQKDNNKNLIKNNFNPPKKFGMAKSPVLKNFKIPKPVAPPVIQQPIIDSNNKDNIFEDNNKDNNEETKKDEQIKEQEIQDS